MLLTESKEGSYSVHLESGSVEQHFMVTLCPCPSDLQLEGGAGANGRRLSSEAESANAKTILSCFPPDLHKSSPGQAKLAQPNVGAIVGAHCGG